MAKGLSQMPSKRRLDSTEPLLEKRKHLTNWWSRWHSFQNTQTQASTKKIFKWVAMPKYHVYQQEIILKAILKALWKNRTILSKLWTIITQPMLNHNTFKRLINLQIRQKTSVSNIAQNFSATRSTSTQKKIWALNENNSNLIRDKAQRNPRYRNKRRSRTGARTKAQMFPYNARITLPISRNSKGSDSGT